MNSKDSVQPSVEFCVVAQGASQKDLGSSEVGNSEEQCGTAGFMSRFRRTRIGGATYLIIGDVDFLDHFDGKLCAIWKRVCGM